MVEVYKMPQSFRENAPPPGPKTQDNKNIEVFNFKTDNSDNIVDQIKCSADLKLPVMEKDAYKGKKIVIVATGPALSQKRNILKIRELVRQRYYVMAIKEAIAILEDAGIRVDFSVSMDPKPNQVYKTPKYPHITYLLASCCSRELFKYLKDNKVFVFHSATGVDNESVYYRHWFKPTLISGQGMTVANRAVDCALYYGFSKITVLGAAFGHREGESFYVNGATGIKTNDNTPLTDDGKIDGKPWFTRSDMVSSAVALVRIAKKCKKISIIGDSMARSMMKFNDTQLGHFVGEDVREVVNEHAKKAGLKPEHQISFGGFRVMR